MGLLKKPRPCHCEECGEVMQGEEHDEAISIHAQTRRLLRCPERAGLFAMTIPTFFQQSHNMAALFQNDFRQTTANRLSSNTLGYRIEGGFAAESGLTDEKKWLTSIWHCIK